MGEEVYHTGTVAIGDAADGCHIFRRFPGTVRPDIAVSVLILFGLHGFLKPFAGNCRVPRNEVEKDMHLSFVCFFK